MADRSVIGGTRQELRDVLISHSTRSMLEISSPVMPPPGVELRTIDGTHTKTLDTLCEAFAEAWHFPPWFGRNGHAFDVFLRDLDNMVNTAIGRLPARMRLGGRSPPRPAG